MGCLQSVFRGIRKGWGVTVVILLSQPSISTAHLKGMHVLDNFYNVVLP